MHKKLHLGIALASAMVAAVGVSCIDKDYQITDVDTVIHFAPGGVAVPLAKLEPKKLGELIGEDVDYLGTDPDDFYLFRYSGSFNYKMGPFSVGQIDIDVPAELLVPTEVSPTDGEPVQATVSLPESSTIIPIEIPSFDFSSEMTMPPLELDKGAFPTNLFPGTSSSLTIPVGGTAISGALSSDTGTIEVDAPLPKEIARVNWIMFGEENQPDGTPVTLTVDLGGLANINGGVVIDLLEVKLPKRYVLRSPSQGVLTNYDGGTDNALTVTGAVIPAGVSSLVLEFSIYSADMSDLPLVPLDEDNNTLATPQGECYSYEIEYTLTTAPGTVSKSDVAPHVVVAGQPTFKDAEFVTDVITLPGGNMTEPLGYRVGPLPSSVERVEKIGFKSNENTMVIRLTPLGLPFVLPQNDPVVKITFPEVFNFVAAPEITGRVLRVKLSQLEAGYPIHIDNVSFGATGGIPDAQGYLDFSEAGYELSVEIDHAFVPETFQWIRDIRDLNPAQQVEVSIGGTSPGAAAVLGIDFDDNRTEFIISAVAKTVTGSGSFTHSFGLQDEIKSLDMVYVSTINDPEQQVEVVITGNIKNPLLDNFFIDELRVSIPEFIVLATHPKIKNNVYYEKRIELTKADYPDPENFDVELARFTILGFKDISVTGGAGAKVGEIGGELSYELVARSDPEGDQTVNPTAPNMVITPQITIPGIKVNRVEGQFDIPLADYLGENGIEPLDLSKIHDKLGEGEQRPDLAPPVITIEINNPTGIALNGNVVLDPKNENGVSIGEDKQGNPVVVETDFDIPSDIAKLYITDDGAGNAPTGYTGYSTPTSALMNRIPHSIAIELDGNCDDTKSGNYVDMDTEYEFTVDYNVEVPLEFGEDMDISIDYDVNDVNGTFAEIADMGIKAREIAVHADMNTSFPLGLEAGGGAKQVVMEFFDEDDELISELVSEVVSVTSEPADGKHPYNTRLTIRLTIPNGGDARILSEVYKLHLAIPVSGAGRVVKLNAADYAQGSVWIELAKGVELDINKL